MSIDAQILSKRSASKIHATQVKFILGMQLYINYINTQRRKII